MSQKTLIESLAEVAQAVRYIQKDGNNSFHKYTYVSEAALVEAVNTELSQRGVVCLPTYEVMQVGDADNNNITVVRGIYTFTNGRDNQVAITYGAGQDKGDKGIYKAMTGAFKYLLRQTFMIATGDDPEKEHALAAARAPLEQPAKPDPKRKVWSLLLEASNGDAATAMAGLALCAKRFGNTDDASNLSAMHLEAIATHLAKLDVDERREYLSEDG